jgi:hypothetical protein
MDLVTILLAAAEGTETHTEHDPTSFYIAGGLLAAFAIVVGIIGITRPALPEGPNRAMMAIGVVLVVATMVASVASS